MAVLYGNDLKAIKDLIEVTIEEVIDRKGVMRRKCGRAKDKTNRLQSTCRAAKIA
jgi:hypothetical protein